MFAYLKQIEAVTTMSSALLNSGPIIPNFILNMKILGCHGDVVVSTVNNCVFYCCLFFYRIIGSCFFHF